MLGYKFDQEALLYLFILSFSVVAVYVFFSSNTGLEGSNTAQGSFEIELEKQPLAPNEISRLQVVDGETGVEGAEVRLDELYIGETNSEGIISFQAMDEDFRVNASVDSKEVSKIVKVSDNQQGEVNEDFGDSSGREDVSDDEGEDQDDGSDEQGDDEGEDQDDGSDDPLQGIKLAEDPEVNTRTRLTLYDEGDRVPDAGIFLDDSKVGETDTTGTLLIDIPYKDEITLSTDVEGIESQNFNVIGFDSEKGINLQSPTDDKVFMASEDGEKEIQFEFTKPLKAEYKLYANGTIIFDGSPDSNNVTEKVGLAAGNYSWNVIGIRPNGEIIESQKRNLAVLNPGSVNINENVTNVEGSVLELAFEIKGAAEKYEIYVNGEKKVEDDVGRSEFYRHVFDEAGDQNIEIKANWNGENVDSVSRTYSTEAAPEAEINWIGPQSADTTTPNTEFEVVSDTSYNLIYEINKGESVTEYNYWSEDRISSNTETHSYTPDPLPKGTHTYDIKVEEDQHEYIIANLSGTIETTEERKMVEVQNLGYKNTEDPDTGEEFHLLSFELKAYEDLQYSINVDGRTPVSDNEFTGTDLSTNEDLGDLTSGSDYTANLTIESLDTEKTLNKSHSFTAQ